MADQLMTAICHYSVSANILEHQLQTDLPLAQALIFITSQSQTAAFSNVTVIWTSNTIKLV